MMNRGKQSFRSLYQRKNNVTGSYCGDNRPRTWKTLPLYCVGLLSMFLIVVEVGRAIPLFRPAWFRLIQKERNKTKWKSTECPIIEKWCFYDSGGRICMRVFLVASWEATETGTLIAPSKGKSWHPSLSSHHGSASEFSSRYFLMFYHPVHVSIEFGHPSPQQLLWIKRAVRE